MLIIERILDILAPHECLSCGTEGSLLCSSCTEQVLLPLPSRCYRCKKLTNDFAVCSKCRKTSSLNNVWVRTTYSGVAKRLIYQMKFKSVREAARKIAELISESLPYFTDDVVIMAIPTATSRKRQRGYDHSKLIAKQLALINKLPYQDGLVRLGQTRQVGMGRQDRLNQLKQAFYVNTSVSNKTVLLVDDIVTTGGTLESAAQELKKSGVQKIYAATFAQK